MNVVNRRDTPRDGVLHVARGGVRIFCDSETGIELKNQKAMSETGKIRAIVLEALPCSRDVPGYVRRHLAGLIGHVPFFAVHSGDRNCALATWAAEHGSIFDRLVISQPPVPYKGALPTLAVPPEKSLIEAVFDDLRAEMAETYEHEPDYAPASHWEARARQFGTSGRAVCYANAPRSVNKMMHATQIETLVPAIRRAATAMKRGSSPPSLMEYGCGIGRLVRYCHPHVAYHGADISRGMVETARTLNPGVQFFTTQALGTTKLPEIDIVLTVTVLHHNDRAERLKILGSAARLAGERVRLVLLEDMMTPAQIKSGNMYPLTVESLLDEITTAFGGTCTQAGFQLLGYKPSDLIPRTALIELDVWR